LLKIGRDVELAQARSVADVRANRDGAAVERALAALKRACASDANVMPPIIEAVNAYATEGEIVESMVEVYGRYVEKAAF
jgi:methylmalonyl-CoA mutase N-terminal domain/subunit